MGEGIYTKGVKTSKRKTRYEDHKRHLTEVGMTLAQRKTTLDIEESIKGNKDESLYVVDRKGNVVASKQGKGASVKVTASEHAALVSKMKDAVITHNHPRAIGRTGLRSIGNSFSSDDLLTAITSNASEIRARTPRYTFSFRRNGDKWNVSERQLKRIIRDAENQVEKENEEYVKRHSFSDRSQAAYVMTFYDKVNKIVASKIGATYTHKRNN